MPWTTPSLDDALLTEPEKNSLKTIAGATDKLQGILDREIAAWRGAIIAGGGRLDQDGTVPDQIIPDLLAVVAWRYLGGYPTLKTLQTKDRGQLYRDALDLRKAISSGQQKVELPAAGQALDLSAPVAPIRTVNRTRRHLTREKPRGL